MSTQATPPTLSDTQKILALLEGMNQRMVRLEASVARLDALVAQGPGIVAGVTDTVDGVVAGMAARGIDVDARMQGALQLTEKLTDPAVLEAVGRLVERLDTVEQSVELAAQAPALVAGVTDTVDGVMAGLAEQGVDVHARLAAGLKAAEALTRPETLAALEKLAASTDKLEQALDLAEAAPHVVAGLTDTLDGVVARYAARGVDLDERLTMLLRAAENLTDPTLLTLLTTITDRGEQLSRMVQVLIESGVFDADAVDVVGAAGVAMVETRMAGAQPMGAFGALRAMGDPDVQRAVGFGLEFARRFGTMLDKNA